MRKRLIGKAFAVAMSGAMVLTATPVTANIFNVAQIVKAAENEASDGYHYCYVGLTWAEYWENEGVYEATNTSSSDVLDSHNEYDKGGYDVVTRATLNHGISRTSFQCMFKVNLKDTDGNVHAVDIAGFVDGSSLNKEFTLVSTDGKQYLFHKNYDPVDTKKLLSTTVTSGSDTYTFVNFQIEGTKYVPVKVANDDWDAFSKAYAGKIIENKGTLNCGSEGEGNVAKATYIASVDATTQGLKTAKNKGDGTFSFTARDNKGTTSGLIDSKTNTAIALRTATDADLNPTVKTNPGSFGEFLRVDFTGIGYGALGANMQAVKWTYYGDDSTRTKALATYGTKFEADNWMHSKQGVQLGLTDSVRCQLPEGTDGTGYWSLTVYALGYEDYTYNFQATKENVVTKSVPATDEEKASLQKLVTEAESFNKDDYCAIEGNNVDSAFAVLLTETAETKDLLAKEDLYSNEVSEQTTHITDAINTVKALKKHDIETVTTPATTEKEGSIVEQCKNCKKVFSTKTIAKLPASTEKPATTTTAKPSATTTVTNKTTVKAPAKTTVKLSKAKKTSLKVSWKKVSGVSAYQIQYSTSKNFKNAKTVKVSAKSVSKVLKKLKKNKKYYVRVRSYKVTKVNNKSKNVYSAWSAKKSLKTKKK